MQDVTRNIDILQAEQKDKPLLWALLQSHLREHATHTQTNAPDADGVYPYKYFDLYWSDPKREVLIYWQAGNAVGFAMINDWSASGLPTDRSMAEFYIRPEFRREGFGSTMAKKIIERRHGQWEIPVAAGNLAAQSFWRKVVLPVYDPSLLVVEGDLDRWSGPISRFIAC